MKRSETVTASIPPPPSHTQPMVEVVASPLPNYNTEVESQ